MIRNCSFLAHSAIFDLLHNLQFGSYPPSVNYMTRLEHPHHPNTNLELASCPPRKFRGGLGRGKGGGGEEPQISGGDHNRGGGRCVREFREGLEKCEK